MKFTSDVLDELKCQFLKLQKHDRQHANGWIQSFLQIQYKTCPICEETHIFACAYPSLEATFRYLYLFCCSQCGLCWVDTNNFNSDDYYRSRYALENRKDRNISPKEYFNPNNHDKLCIDFYFKRAKKHNDFLTKSLQSSKAETALDFGSGPGYFLYLNNSAQKYAIEEDKHCEKYLNYINAKLVTLNNLQNNFFDCICASHSLEHLSIYTLQKTLTIFYLTLKDNGILLIEVPNGSLLRNHIYQKHDPHTIFFTPDSLQFVLSNVGFSTVYFIENEYYKPLTKRTDSHYSPKNYAQLCDNNTNITLLCSKISNDSRLTGIGVVN